MTSLLPNPPAEWETATTDPSLQQALQIVEDASVLRCPVVVLVTDATLQGADARARYAADLAARGCSVIQFTWNDAPGSPVLADVDAVLRRAAMSTVAVLADVLVRSVSALTVVETAWHAGALAVLRCTRSDATTNCHTGEASTYAEATAYADVVVCRTPASSTPSGVSTKYAAHFESDDALTLIGPLEPVSTDLTLTVLVTTFDRPVELADCLEGLTRQTLDAHRFDVVVVDDGSPIDVTTIVERFAGRLRINLLRLPKNSGIGAARAAGVSVATGDIVMLLDDDDVVTPRTLAEHLREHQLRPGEDVAVLGHTVVQPSNHPDVLSRHVTWVGRQYFAFGIVRDGCELGWEWCWGGRSTVKRSLLARIPFRSTVMEDTDFSWRADQYLKADGSGLKVIYSRRALQVAASPLRLAQMRRRQMKMGLASGVFKRSIGEDLTEHLGGAVGILRARAALPKDVVSRLDGWASQSLVEVRSTAATGAVEKRLARLDSLLMTDISAHHALGVLAAEVTARLQARGELPVVGLNGNSQHAAEVVAATHQRDGVRLVVGLDPAELDPEGFVAILSAKLSSRGRDLDDLGEVELRIGPDDVSTMPDVHFFIPSEDGDCAPRPSGQLPLFGLQPLEWVSWFTSRGKLTGALR